MPKFDYVLAGSLEHAIRLMNDTEYTNKLIAGGTDLLVYLHYEQPPFTRVVDISFLDELKKIEQYGDEIVLGAGVCFTDIIESSLLLEKVPFLVEACRSIGSPQIRNLGTLGGNVVNAAACADSLPVLVSLEAIAHLVGPAGERDIPVTDLVEGPNQARLESGEILVYFVFKIPPEGVETSFIKLGRRNAQAISRLSMAAMGRLDNSGQIDFVRIVPGAATPKTIRFAGIETALLGKKYSPEFVHQIAELAAEEMISITGWRWSTEYKAKVIAVLVERVLTQVFAPEALVPEVT